MGFYSEDNREPRVGEGEEYELKAPDDERLYDLVHQAKIIGWRQEQFEKLGLEPIHASSLACRRDIDSEDVRRLVQGGATSEQVALILL